jgi:hypothetical protein
MHPSVYITQCIIDQRSMQFTIIRRIIQFRINERNVPPTGQIYSRIRFLSHVPSEYTRS